MLWGVHANWPHSHICCFNFNTSFEQKSSSNEAKDSQRDFFFPPAGQCDLMSFPWTETSLSTAKARIQAGVNATELGTPGETRKVDQPLDGVVAEMNQVSGGKWDGAGVGLRTFKVFQNHGVLRA